MATSTPTPSTATPQPTATPVVPTATPTFDPNLVLPDLQTLPPRDVVIETTTESRRLLRFTNSILNAGPGTLELLGVLNPATNKTAVTQHIATLTGAIEEHAAGEFVFHPDHDHWHLENFALYEVWSLTPEGDLDAVVAFTDKVSYCNRDNSRSAVAGAAPRARFTGCNRELQGISVGWIDIYTYNTPGQIVDITRVLDGVYALQSTVDPDDYLWEVDDTNNAGVVYFELMGRQVQILDRADAVRSLRLRENP
jgi:hypothetical protein